MARSSWMAKKFTRGMTYQWKAKDLANAREYIFGLAKIAIYVIMNDFLNVVVLMESGSQNKKGTS